MIDTPFLFQYNFIFAKFVLAKKKKRLLAILPMVLYETMIKQQFIITIIKFCTLVKNKKK
jgi:hypothetical protein